MYFSKNENFPLSISLLQFSCNNIYDLNIINIIFIIICPLLSVGRTVRNHIYHLKGQPDAMPKVIHTCSTYDFSKTFTGETQIYSSNLIKIENYEILEMFNYEWVNNLTNDSF